MPSRCSWTPRAATLTAQWSQAGIEAQLDDFSARRGSIDLAVRGRLSLPAGGEPDLYLQAGTPQAPAADFFALLPDRALSPKFIDWGRQAIQAGTLTDVQALLRGNPKRFPFRDGQGQFLGTATFADIALDYQPGAGWPAVSEGRGRFGLRGPEFSLTLDDGRLLDSRATDVQVRIPDVAAPAKRLLLDGTARGAAQDVIRFVQQSPLAARFGSRVDRLAFDGAAQTQVKLDLVFTGPVKSTQVSGSTLLAGNTLTVAGTGLVVQDLRGALGFSEGGVSAKAVAARLFGGPVMFDLATAAGGGLRIEPRGQADAAEVTRYLRLPWPDLFTGAVPWQGSVDIAGDGGLDLDLNLDVAKATGELPAPLDVLRSQPLQVRAHCACAAPPRAWNVRLAAQPLIAQLELLPTDGGGTVLRRGDLAIGVETRMPPAGFNVHGRMAQLPLAPWIVWLGSHFGGTAGGAWPSPRVDVYADRLDYLGQSFSGVRLQVLRSEGWDVDLDAPDVAGTVHARGWAPGSRWNWIWTGCSWRAAMAKGRAPRRAWIRPVCRCCAGGLATFVTAARPSVRWCSAASAWPMGSISTAWTCAATTAPSPAAAVGAAPPSIVSAAWTRPRSSRTLARFWPILACAIWCAAAAENSTRTCPGPAVRAVSSSPG